MKAILNYKGFIKEMEIKEPSPYIFIAVPCNLCTVGMAKKETDNVPPPPSVEKLRFLRRELKTEGFWIFKKRTVYYQFDDKL